MSAGARFHPPAWLLWESEPGVLAVRDMECAEGFSVKGELRERLWHEPEAARETLAAMGEFDPTIQRFERAFDPAKLAPLDRATLLRGAGFEQLFVELTARCNERCGHCYAGSSPEREETLDVELAFAALQDARELGFAAVQLTGGDPLLSPHCADVARRVRELGFESLEVYTNGLLLRGALYESLREAGASFAFSFYSADPAIHDGMTRTPGSQRRTLAAIRRVARDGLELRASVVLNADTAPGLERTLGLLREAGVPERSIAIDQERGVGRGRYAELSMGAFTSLGRGAHAGGLRGFAGKAAIAPDGRVYPCIFGRSTCLGDLRQQSLRQVLCGDGEGGGLGPVAHALEGAGALHTQLSCWECRLRSALLPGAPRAQLVSLRTAERAG